MQRDVVINFRERVVPEGTNRYGLVVGIDHYTNSRLDLRYAVADARILYDLMVDPECGCFPPNNVQLLVDDAATTNGIFQALARLRKQAGENDIVWIYYAGHAAVEDDGRAYWVTHDTNIDDLFATGLSDDRINTVLSKIRAKRLFRMLDCCYAEATAHAANRVRQVVLVRKLLEDFQGNGCITLAASNGTQRSVELAELGHGAFTYFLERGLRGEADLNNDGVVTADELWSYLRGKVTQAAGGAGTTQTPMIIGSMTHDVALTLNSAATAHAQKLVTVLEGLVGIRAEQLTTDEGKLCERILLRGARTDLQRSLLESLAEVAEGELTAAQFLRLLRAAKSELLGAGVNAEKERAEKERAEKERAEKRRKQERAVREQLERERAERERADLALMAREQAEREQAEREQAEHLALMARERAESEYAEKVQADKVDRNRIKTRRFLLRCFLEIGLLVVLISVMAMMAYSNISVRESPGRYFISVLGLSYFGGRKLIPILLNKLVQG